MAFYKGKQGKWITTKTGNHVFIEDGKSVEEVLTELYGVPEEYEEDFDSDNEDFDNDNLTEEDPEWEKILENPTFESEPITEDLSVEPESNEEEEDSKSLKEVKKIRRVLRKLKLSDEDIRNELLKTNYFNEEAINNLSDKQRKKLFIAYKVYQDKNIILDNYKNKLFNSLQLEYNNLWKNLEGKLSDPETFNKSLESKTEYFNIKGDQESLNKLEEIKNLPEYKEYLNSYDVIKKYESYVNKFEDKSTNLYSQKNKDEAFWAKTDTESEEKFKSYFDKVYEKLTDKEKNMIEKYTGTFSYINEPLRNITYSGPKYKQKEFIKDVENLTKALDKSTYDFNTWVQRGVNDLNINGISIDNISNVDSLIGTTFKDHGFLSCGSHKQSGFVHKNIIMNIYCPKGTKMMWIKPMSGYKHEDETIIQRGYSFKITKVERKGGKTYIDLDCIVGSDENKYDKNKLKELQQSKFHS